MNKFFGPVGYAETVEAAPGVWRESITERNYYGDVIRNTRRLESSGFFNENITISNQISIVSDPYAVQNFLSIRYVKWMGVAWKVVSVEVQSPRLLLSLGEVYNGEGYDGD